MRLIRGRASGRGAKLNVAPREIRTIKKKILTKRYEYCTIEEFNVDSKAECDQLNLAHMRTTNDDLITKIGPLIRNCGDANNIAISSLSHPADTYKHDRE